MGISYGGCIWLSNYLRVKVISLGNNHIRRHVNGGAAFFRNANPDPNYVYYYSDFSGVDPTLPRLMYQFGYTTKIFMTTVQVAVIMGATFFQILAGMYFGTRKSYIYLVAVITCFCVDLCLVENVHVVVRGIIYNFWMKVCVYNIQGCRLGLKCPNFYRCQTLNGSVMKLSIYILMIKFH